MFLSSKTRKQTSGHFSTEGGEKKAFLNKDFRVTVKKESHFHKAILVASGNVTLL